MQAWGEQAGADGKVTMLADGNGDFAEALGLAMDFSKFGMGKRSQRWSAIVDDGVVSSSMSRSPAPSGYRAPNSSRPSSDAHGDSY